MNAERTPPLTWVILALGAGLITSGRHLAGAVVLAATLIRLHLTLLPSRIAGPARRRVHRAAGMFSTTLRAVLFGPVFLAILMAWTLTGLIRLDRFHRRAEPRWTTLTTDRTGDRRGQPAPAIQLRVGTTLSPTRSPRPTWTKAVATTAAFTTVAAIAYVAATSPWPNDEQGARVQPAATPYALRGQPEIGLEQQDERDLIGRYQPDAEVGWRLPKSFESQTVNVVDGHRASVQAATTGPIIWFFGGSTMWGSNQRDAFTIPSQYARIAADEGQPVRVVNWGVHAYTSSQEAKLFATAVRSQPGPDLVIFYDGYNDTTISLAGSFLGQPLGVPQRAPVPNDPDSGAAPPPSDVPWLSPDTRYDNVVTILREAMALADRSARRENIAVVHLWQPNVFTRRPTDAERAELASAGIDGTALATLTAIHGEVRRRLPDEVVDLADALDGEPTVYADQVHTNELGALLMARAIYEATATSLPRPPGG